MTEGLRRVLARPAGQPEAEEWVAEEVPVALALNGISQAVMLATPLDLEDFALGFALSEGWLRDAAELLDVDLHPADGSADGTAAGLTLELRTTAAAAVRAAERRRTLAGRTGCGLCGIESLAQWPRPARRALPPVPLDAVALDRALTGLQAGQQLNARCGGLHAAAWCSREGQVLALREDVGRHNALDKLIGALLRQGRSPREEGFACITSRASFEMVQKAARANIATVAAVSAPTQLAVQLAHDAGLLLLGFVRGTDWVAYTQLDRIAD